MFCLSSCEQHEAYQTARAVVCSAEAEQREAEENREGRGGVGRGRIGGGDESMRKTKAAPAPQSACGESGSARSQAGRGPVQRGVSSSAWPRQHLRALLRAARTARHVVKVPSVVKQFGLSGRRHPCSPTARARRRRRRCPPASPPRCALRAQPTDRFASSIECDARRERVVQLFAPKQLYGVAGLRLALQNELARRKHPCSAELRNKTCTQRSVLHCTAQRPALWAPYRIPPMDFRFYSIPSRSSAQQ